MSEGDYTIKLTADGQKLMAALKELEGMYVSAGFQEGLDEHKSKDGKESVDMCLVAAYNEFGSSTTPARPFLKNSLELHKDVIQKFCKEELKLIANGKQDSETALKQIGSDLVKVVQEEITEGTYAPNAPSTIKKKGSDHPLIDQGLMRKSVHAFIGKNGGEAEVVK